MLDPKADIAHTEEVILAVGPGRARVLPRAQKKVEGDGATDAHSVGKGVGVGGRAKVEGELDQFDRDGACAGRGGIGFGPSPEEGHKAEVSGAIKVEAGVRGPHAGERLAHGSYGVLHCSRSNRVAAGREGAGAVAVGKQEEKR